ncbi:hypothetical protein L227DRAFT_591105 [Lentinus tigrinus ALCF2SS1-6]|uniref:DUF6533 domain-containing protein n=1 Tax=Lentinus tigrinus ALCF2SS1-6 TaxID=1328759 RepID=A0A5C2SNV4_9APHY|nr:hypothetical protein L227DRAFT_591105 [Lentinus tigrinus ALCF2SS1-6]
MATATLSPDILNELNELVRSLDALERARYLSIACTCVLAYDFMLTFGDEVRYFWNSPWSLSRGLFFLNRYIPPCVMAVCLVAFLAPGLSVQRCSKLIHGNFLATILAIAVIQAIIVLRICLVYARNRLVQSLVVGSFVVCSIITVTLFGTLWHDLDPIAIDVPGLKINSCTTPPSREIWKLYVPNLVLHTILYLATTVPVLKLRAIGKQSQLLNRLARDGGIFYFVVFASALFSTLGALSSDMYISVPAIYSDLLLALSAASISRLMLGIRSLAARLSVAPDWLLNNTELGRVNWKPGRREGELIVEVEAVEDELELKSVDDDGEPIYNRARTPVLHTTRVGVLNHPVYPGTRDYKAPPRLPKKSKASHSAASDRPAMLVRQSINRRPLP